MTKVSLHFTRGVDRRQAWGRKDEEYVADFILIARRTLTPEEYKVFNYHFLLGADWRLCTRKLKMDRGTFFHAVYRVQQILGRTFRELEPFGLYPLDEYFCTTINTAEPVRMPPPDRTRRPLQPPVTLAA
jgi:hypothetical protein